LQFESLLIPESLPILFLLAILGFEISSQGVYCAFPIVNEHPKKRAERSLVLLVHFLGGLQNYHFFGLMSSVY